MNDDFKHIPQKEITSIYMLVRLIFLYRGSLQCDYNDDVRHINHNIDSGNNFSGFVCHDCPGGCNVVDGGAEPH